MPPEGAGPNFFVAGTTKAGTSTLHLWLSSHPRIYLVPDKEVHHLCSCPARLRRVGDRGEYLGLFAGVDQPVRGEASPCYLYYEEVPARIAEAFPGSRILVSLRDPVERFWSHYLMNDWYREDYPSVDEVLERWPGRTPRDATEDLVGMGFYAEQLERYLSSFGRERVEVVFLEELSSAPEDVLEGIWSFLGLEPHRVDTTDLDKRYVAPRHRLASFLLRNPVARRTARLAPARMRRVLKYRVLGDPSGRPGVPDQVRPRLEGIYRADTRWLEGLLGRPLPWRWHEA